MRDDPADRDPDGPTGSFEMFIERRRKKQARERRRRRQALLVASLSMVCAALAVSTTFLAFRLTAATTVTVPQAAVAPSADRGPDGSRPPGVTKPAVGEPRATPLTEIAARGETPRHGQPPGRTPYTRERDTTQAETRGSDGATADVATGRDAVPRATRGDGRRERQPATRIGPHGAGSGDMPLAPDGTRAGPSLTADWMVKSLGRTGAEERVQGVTEFYPRDHPAGEYWRAVLAHIRRFE